MFIPPKKHLVAQAAVKSDPQLLLASAHVIIPKEILDHWEEEVENVFFVYYPDRSQLLLAPVSHDFFTKVHEAGQLFLKVKNLRGDKSMAIHEILIDHEIDQTNRPLDFEFMGKHGILKIYI